MEEEVPPALPAPVTAFTGFKMHLRTWRFKFDATPNRRPHVSQTKAERKKKGCFSILITETTTIKPTFFTSMDKEMLYHKKSEQNVPACTFLWVIMLAHLSQRTRTIKATIKKKLAQRLQSGRRRKRAPTDRL